MYEATPCEGRAECEERPTTAMVRQLSSIALIASVLLMSKRIPMNRILRLRRLMCGKATPFREDSFVPLRGYVSNGFKGVASSNFFIALPERHSLSARRAAEPPNKMQRVMPASTGRRAAHGMQLLQRKHRRRIGAVRSNRFHDGLRAGHGRHAGNVVLQSGVADCLLVKVRDATERRVDNQRDATPLDMVHNVWPSFIYLENIFNLKANFAQARRRPQGGHEPEPQSRQAPRQHNRLALVRLVDANKGQAALRQRQSGPRHRFRIRLAEGLADAHDFSGRMHLGP